MSTNTKCNFFLAFLFVDLDINSENIDNDDADPQKIDAQLIKDMLNTLNLQNPSTLGFEDGDNLFIVVSNNNVKDNNENIMTSPNVTAYILRIEGFKVQGIKHIFN